MAEPFHPVNGVWKEINDTDWDSVIAEFEQLRQELVPMKLPSKVQRLGAIDQCVKSLEKMLTLLHYEKRQTVHDVVFFGERGSSSQLAREMGVSRQRISDQAQKAAHERLAGHHPLKKVAGEVQ
jgi:nitrate reductase beta subunit|tara:strand:- start:268 stop:639 length:372 start_codon:yes stop_codon:yes gene_type:complete